MSERFSLVQRLDFIRSKCVGKKVLHLGCTNYPYTKEAIDNDMLLHFELEKIATELYGFDADKPGLEILRENGAINLYEVDLERLDSIQLDEKFDVIIAGEMIEHLNNPGLFLNGIKRFMHNDTSLVLTTINAYCAMRFIIYFLRGKGGVSEPVHPDHVSYYSYRTLKLIIERHELSVDHFCFYDIGNEHRPFSPWYYNIFNDISVKLSHQVSDGIIAVAKLKQ